MSFSTILSAVIEGLEVAFIHVEADISNGLPVFHMVGYLSSEVKEAGERVRTAIKNSGFEYPAKRTVVNLSPATMRKHGASFDLPIAAAILTALGQIEKPEKDCLIIGELSLGGSVKKVSGVLPIVMEAKEIVVGKCIVPSENVTEASLVSEMEIVGAATLQEAVEAMQNRRKRKKIQNKEITDCGNLRKTVQKETKFPDFADMKGQEFVKRAHDMTGNEPMKTIEEAEIIGPTGCLDILILMPCTGNTMAKLANGITDTPVLMAAKAQLRNEKPVVISMASNDALGMNLKNIGNLLNHKHIYFVPFGQDDPVKKPNSMIADTRLLIPTILQALKGRQYQPVLIDHKK